MKNLVICVILLSLFSFFSCKPESKITKMPNNEDTVYNDSIKGVFFDTPFGASKEELTRNFENKGLSLYADSTIEETKYCRQIKDKYFKFFTDFDFFRSNYVHKLKPGTYFVYNDKPFKKSEDNRQIIPQDGIYRESVPEYEPIIDISKLVKIKLLEEVLNFNSGNNDNITFGNKTWDAIDVIFTNNKFCSISFKNYFSDEQSSLKAYQDILSMLCRKYNMMGVYPKGTTTSINSEGYSKQNRIVGVKCYIDENKANSRKYVTSLFYLDQMIEMSVSDDL